MIDRPALRLRIEPADELLCHGPLADRTKRFALHWAQFHQLPQPRCSIEVLESPPEHVGLGVGTQLGLAIAAGLSALVGLPSMTGPELAISVARGQRSAVGTYGFTMGGLIVEKGKLPGEPISPLDCRIDLPIDWRFLLVRPLGSVGLSGSDEAAAIDSLPAIEPETTERLVAEARDHLIPAAATGDFPAFAASVYRYGHLSGSCFAARQGGPFNGPLLAELVEQVRRLGGKGAGQSSWGPTIFAALENEAQAKSLQHSLQAAWSGPPLDFVIAAPNNRGAQIDVTHQKSRTNTISQT